MQPHHKAWLIAHPDRTSYWLKARVAEGFDVHHLDGDRRNNDPDNLVLIESSDHVRMHRPGGGGHEPIRNKARQVARARRRAVGPLAYKLRKDTGASWNTIAFRTGTTSPGDARDAAEEYAMVNDLEWPPVTDDEAKCMRKAATLHRHREAAERIKAIRAGARETA